MIIRNNSEKYYIKYFLNEYQYIIDNTKFLPENSTFSERKYCIKHNIIERPKCPICNTEYLKFKNITTGYNSTCSNQECFKKNISNKVKNNLTDEKRKKISLKSKQSWKNRSSEDILNRTLKQKQTKLERYGVETYNNTSKRKSTNLERYGVEFGLSNENIKEKSRETKLKNHGFEYYTNRNKAINTMIEKYGESSYARTDEYRKLFNNKEWLHSKLQKEYETKKKNNTFNSSIPEEKTYFSLCCLFPNLTIERQYKSELYPFNCDFYIKEKDLYIECNYSWTHKPVYDKYGIILYDENNPKHVKMYQDIKDNVGGYTLDTWTTRDPLKRKTAKENNLNFIEFFFYEDFLDWCITQKYENYVVIPYIPNYKKFLNKYNDKIIFWDYEWNNKNEICKSILNKNKNVIYARKCDVKEISSKESNEFLNFNHIQGAANTSIKLGLFHNNELVEVMTFGKPRFNKNYQYELIRLCSLLNTTIVGGAEKLFKYFIENYKPNSIVSYCDKRIFKGEIYKRLGFEFKSSSESNYNYIGRYSGSRIKFQKFKLKDILEEFNQNESELWNMEHNESYPVYDLGNDTWIWKE